MTHTPGPWSVGTGLPRPEIPAVYSPAGNTTGDLLVCIADCQNWNSLPDSQRYANARLMAAAPDLLEALKAIMAVVPEHSLLREANCWSMARAAIAKAMV